MGHDHREKISTAVPVQERIADCRKEIVRYRMVIQRDRYLQKLIHRRENGMVKVITGIRRCGNSYLLFGMYHPYMKRP